MTDQRTAEGHEREMNIVAALVADDESAELGEPSQRSLDDPAMAPEALRTLDAAARDACEDAAQAQRQAADAVVVGLVGMQLVRPRPRPAGLAVTHRVDQINHPVQEQVIVQVRGAEIYSERNTAPLDQYVLFRAGFSLVGRVRAGKWPPFFAATLRESSDARDQSSLSARASSSSNTLCSRSQTPACCQSRSRRQHVTPEPHPSSRGKYSQGIPVRSTKMMPRKHSRSPIRGRPPLALGLCFGNSGATIAHNSSDTKAFMPGLDMSPLDWF